MSLGQQVHDDPFAEGARSALQAVGSLVTVFEAAARVWAVGVQNQAAAQERAAGQQENARRLQEQAARLRKAEDAQWQKHAEQIGTDRKWLREEASLGEAAHAWQWGMARRGGDPMAAQIADDADLRLRHLEPDLMERYDRLRADGVPVHEAMADAADRWWRAKWGPRAQPGQSYAAGALQHRPGGLDAFDQAVRAEVAVLARDLNPDTIAAFQQEMRRQGVMTGSGLDLLRTYCAQQAPAMPPTSELMAARIIEDALRADSRTRAGVLDVPATPADEHTAGQADSTRLQGAADQTAAAAARRASGPAAGEPAGRVRAAVAQAFPPLRPAAPPSTRAGTPVTVPGGPAARRAGALR
ncbi:hypothetical protein [Actinoplanes sp. L3-i22]|uniref:hypothetical protein n=1 Tax=Actinoplanes sp. L3-i22 TaxID=2836373 RepID=UPI001C742E19|nr:hypothetical protein [Actinoplanes sp. L3-i22]BCY10987.1 hypothetical protein L3i22_060750 [Actinoplanes sp. L3-i22]